MIGARGDRALFARFLADRRIILARRTQAAIEAFVAVGGVAGLVLAGGVARGEPWPLSDVVAIAATPWRAEPQEGHGRSLAPGAAALRPFG